MPQIGFICPDGEQVTFAACTESCRMGRRCCPIPYLRAQVIQRKLDHFTVTELLAPTRQMALKLTTDYFESPSKGMARLLGSARHYVLEQRAGADELTEERLRLDLGNGRITSGKADVYSYEEEAIEDYKFWKVFKIRKMLGRFPDYRLAAGLNGTGFEPSDDLETVLQLNTYRIIWQRAGFPVKVMRLWVCPSDISAINAKAGKPKEGVFTDAMIHPDGSNWGWVLFDIAPVDDDRLISYLGKRYDALKSAVDSGISTICTPEETWQGKRCQGWCPVSDVCERKEMEAHGR